MTFDPTTSAPIDLDAIRYRLTEATPGPWGVGNGTHIVRGLEVTGRGSFTCIQSVAEIDDEDDRLDWGHADEVEVDPEADARFIAGARTLVPALCAEVDRHRAALDAEQTRTSRLEDALAATEQQAASMRIALDKADAEAEGR
ncbi:hypothetical protein C5N14_13760 [Micromonospora sp. MW-13]|uniref:hypothetical protein n=1 Tax=Micromonospora sp. MW-13 TaxID=2094022 RepID=UPI000E434584|nr:hypothetical protein [Micromonospora sp. MW-13]RGC68448.1 hypothetical protein C5N14_13760 [Micromonospora sp. MW-13]